VFLGAILFVSGLVLLSGRATLGTILVIVGLLAFVSGAVRFCALYMPFGVSTAQSGGKQVAQKRDCGTFMKEVQTRPNSTEGSVPAKQDAATPVGTSTPR
jgi:hypothetical protein